MPNSLQIKTNSYQINKFLQKQTQFLPKTNQFELKISSFISMFQKTIENQRHLLKINLNWSNFLPLFAQYPNFRKLQVSKSLL